MGRTFGRRVLEFLWGPEEDDGEYAYDEETTYDDDPYPAPVVEEPPSRPAPPRRWGLGRGEQEVVELRPPRQPRTEVRYPRSFTDAQKLADQFKQGAFLIIDLEQVDEAERGGIVKFLCGVAYGLDGKSHRINDLTFLFAPRQFDLQADAQPAGQGDPATSIPRFSLPS